MKRVCINDDETRVIEFDPTDILFAERFYDLYKDMDAKNVELNIKKKQIDASAQTKDANGISTNIREGLDLVREVCDFMREKIDNVFGPGTSQKAFGEARSIEMIVQFLEGITPFIERSRGEKMKKYVKPRGSKVMQ
jgi:hypothetical protein